MHDFKCHLSIFVPFQNIIFPIKVINFLAPGFLASKVKILGYFLVSIFLFPIIFN
jgi:hypothetical protein